MSEKIINVASVAKLSPFRYAGGKTWLVPHIRTWLQSLTSKPKYFIEPFLGGGIVSLSVGFEDRAGKVLMSELDDEVSAVWLAVLGGDAKWLADKILEFSMTEENVRQELDRSVRSLRAKAFQTVLKNRTYHGGILAAGAGFIKNGENGKGLKSRWYPSTLAKRILEIEKHKSSFDFVQGDGLELMSEHVRDRNAVFFIDPPYTAGGAGKRAGRRLYNHNELDHQKLFDLASKVKGDFLMTYDNDQEVIQMARSNGFDTELVAMKNTHHAKMHELLIGKDLSWARKGHSKPIQQELF